MDIKENWEEHFKTTLQNAEVEAPLSLWDKIEQDLPVQKRRKMMFVHTLNAVAASFLVLLGAGVWWFADQYGDFGMMEQKSKWIELQKDSWSDSQRNTAVSPKIQEVEPVEIEKEVHFEKKAYQVTVGKIKTKPVEAIHSSQKVDSYVSVEAQKQKESTFIEDKKVVVEKEENISQIHHKVELKISNESVVDEEVTLVKQSVDEQQEDDIVVITDFRVLKKPIEKVIKAQERLHQLVEKVLPKKSLEFEIHLGKSNK